MWEYIAINYIVHVYILHASGIHRLERMVVLKADFVGRREMMIRSISSGRELMRSRLDKGSSDSGSTRLRFLSASASISAGGDTRNPSVSG